MKSKVFDHNDVRDTIFQAQAITHLVQLATQATDELSPETVYHLMRALEGILDEALEGLQPLVDEEDAAIKRLFAGQR